MKSTVPTAPATPTDAPAPALPAAPRPPLRRISSRELLAGATEIEIDHHGMCYRLRHTAQGKLILTK